MVTAFDAERRPRGLTLVAFAGVSLSPPLVLVCVDRESHTLPAIRHSGGFTVNIVSRESGELARLMATKSEEKFEGVAWIAPSAAEGGPILIQQAAAYLVCRTWQEVEAGDHLVFIGEVLEGAVEDREPLLFHRRDFRGLVISDG